MQEMQVRSLGQDDPLEKEMATHSSILDCKIPQTEEPGSLQSVGSQRAGRKFVTKQQNKCRKWTSAALLNIQTHKHTQFFRGREQNNSRHQKIIKTLQPGHLPSTGDPRWDSTICTCPMGCPGTSFPKEGKSFYVTSDSQLRHLTEQKINLGIVYSWFTLWGGTRLISTSHCSLCIHEPGWLSFILYCIKGKEKKPHKTIFLAEWVK